MKLHSNHKALRCFIMTLAGLLLLASAAGISEATVPKNVLILLSSEYGLPAYDSIISGIRSTLRNGISGPLNLYAEYLDIDRFTNLQAGGSLSTLLNNKYGGLRIDLLIFIGPNLAPVVDGYLRSGLPEAPAVVLDLITPGSQPAPVLRMPQMAGVFLEIETRRTLELMLSLHPGTRHLWIVSGAFPTGVVFNALSRKAAHEIDSTLDVHSLVKKTMAEILQTVAALPPHSLVLITSFRIDASGNHYYSREATELVAGRSTAPVYILFDTNADVGAVGGYVMSFKNLGIKGGEIALRLLRGESPSSIPPVREGLHQYMFDWRQLKRWGIPEQKLPEGSVVLHREINVFQKYKWLVIGIVLFVALQSLLLGFLVVLNRKHRVLSANLMAAESRYRQLLRIERLSRLGEFSASLAHELNQPLAAVVSSSQAALRFLRASPIDIERLREILQHVVQDSKRSAEVVRSMRAMLKRDPQEKVPVSVDAVLNDVLIIFKGEAASRRIRIERHCQSALPPVMADKSQLQQVMLNLIMNAADAVAKNMPENRKIFISIRLKDGKIQVAMRDTGTGIDPARIDEIFEPLFTTKSRGMGMGLALCRTIIQEHGGRIRIENNADGGATATFELPVIQND
jgi:signal transduction histidine kinase